MVLPLAFLLLFLGGSRGDEAGRSFPKYHHHQEYEPYHDVVAVTEPDIQETYYTPPRYRPMHTHHEDKGIDLTSLGILAIIKLLLVKIKGMGLGLLLLLKLPFILFFLLAKLLFALKLAKLFKLLAIPLLFLPLLLVLAPILLLVPLLLPLLLALPVPVLTPAGRKRRTVDHLSVLRRVLEADSCVERIACSLAAEQDPFYNASMNWGLKHIKSFVPSPKVSSYADAYEKASKSKSSRKDCFQMYPCNKQISRIVPYFQK